MGRKPADVESRLSPYHYIYVMVEQSNDILMVMITVGRKPGEVKGRLSSNYGYDDDDSFDNGYYKVILKMCYSSN